MQSRKTWFVAVLTALALMVMAGPALARNGGGGDVNIGGGGGYGGSYGNDGRSPDTQCSGGGSGYKAGGKNFWYVEGCPG